jgi:hypothetical protein
MPTNDFQIFAGAGGANVITTSAYAALSARTAGFATGLARSNQTNKAWRQSSIISSMLAQAISDTLGVDVVDDGTIAAIETHFYQMLFQQVMVNEYVQDTSVAANTITVTPTPPVLSYFNGLTLRIKVANQNNAAMFINVSGLGVKSLVAPSGSTLASGAVYAGQMVTVTYDAPANVFKLAGGEVPYLGRSTMITFSSTFVVPAGVRLLKVRMVGAGGGASGSSTTTNGAGGGGGEYREGTFIVTPGQGIAATIGAGGAGGSAGIFNGTNGGSTSFGALMSASGGSGGGIVGGVGGGAGFSAGGAGGTGGSGGSIALAGGSGGDGLVGSAPAPAPAGTIVYMPGYGGASILGTSVRAGTFSSGSAGNGNNFGGGGAGSYFFLSSTSASVAGGSGAQGVIILEY